MKEEKDFLITDDKINKLLNIEHSEDRELIRYIIDRSKQKKQRKIEHFLKIKEVKQNE